MFPYLILSACSFWIILIEITTIARQIAKNTNWMNQYSHEHDLIPMEEARVLVGRHTFIPMRVKIRTKLIAHLTHCACVPS